MRPPGLTDLDPLERLAARIRSRDAVAAVVGLGYVGLPLLTAMDQAGFHVIGVDQDPAKIAALRERRSYIVDVPDSEIHALGQPVCSETPAPLAEADVVVLCLPTPLTDGAPDLTMVLTAAERSPARSGPG